MNKNIYSAECLTAFKEAIAFAEKKKYEYLSVDNLMLFLARTKYGQEFFKSMGLNIDHFEEEVIRFLNDNVPKITGKADPEYTVSLKNLEEIAFKATKASGKSKIEEGYLLACLYELSEDECFTLNYFTSFDISRFDVMSYVSQGKKKVTEEKQEIIKKENGKQFLNKYGILLNEKANNNKIDNVIGRQKEITSMIEILCQKKKNNPVLVGEPGVGKTAIIEGLAKQINDGKVPQQIAQAKIYLIDVSSMIAGSKYRGDFEEKFKGVIKEASEDKDVILAIDEIHTLVGSGSNQGTMDGANMLKPMLASGEIKLIGATTYDEYRKFFEKDAALTRRFKKIDIVEPTAEETISILHGLKEEYEKFHKVSYDDKAIEKAVILSVKFINDKFLPDKAFDIIDLAGSKAKLNNVKKIDVSFINKVFSDITRIPVGDLEDKEKTNIKNLNQELKDEIFGQNEAIEKIVDSIVLAKSNLIPKEKPIGSFLFAGPSGVGKTELTKQIAKKLNIPLLRFDMSEYMEKHSVAKFIGTAPGYVGFEQGGILVEAIKKNPSCVLLLDEIEKAHEDILNILLQVMDYASLTDNQGRKANFKNVILVMTSNMGAK